jgi:hypothetical protein
MKKIITAAVFVVGMISVRSQTIFPLTDPVSSRMFSMERYSGTKGTPFLVDKWMKGNVTVARGIYKDLDLKYNVYDNILLFNKDDDSYELTDDIIAFTLMPKADDTSTHMVFRKGVTGPEFKAGQFVQVMTEGPNASVYKLAQKQLSEKSEINAGMIKTFADNAKYYIRSKTGVHFVKLNQSDILSVLNDQATKLKAFIDERKLRFRKDTDLVELVKYYNTL